MNTFGPALMFIAIDLIVIGGLTWMTWASMTGRLGIDGFGGFRTYAATTSPAAWQAGHAAVWPMVRFVAAVMIALVAVGVYLLSTGQRGAAALALQAPILLAVIALVPMIKVVNRGAEAAQRRPRR